MEYPGFSLRVQVAIISSEGMSLAQCNTPTEQNFTQILYFVYAAYRPR